MKRLFALSGNRCAFPRCSVAIFSDGTLLGEICHIHAAKPRGPRYNEKQTPADRHGFANLILLCCNHHQVIDDDWEAYTAERLFSMKHAHEAKNQFVDLGGVDHAVQYLIDQSVRVDVNIGGITAKTINAGTINLNTSNTASSPKVTTERRGKAIEVYWNVIVKLRSEFSSVLIADQVLTPIEFNACFSGYDSNVFFEGISGFESSYNVLNIISNSGASDAEKERPFVSIRQYLLYSAMHIVLLRSALMISQSFSLGRYVNWREDELIERKLREVLSANVLAELRLQNGYCLNAILNVLAGEFIEENQ